MAVHGSRHFRVGRHPMSRLAGGANRLLGENHKVVFIYIEFACKFQSAAAA